MPDQREGYIILLRNYHSNLALYITGVIESVTCDCLVCLTQTRKHNEVIILNTGRTFIYDNQPQHSMNLATREKRSVINPQVSGCPVQWVGVN